MSEAVKSVSEASRANGHHTCHYKEVLFRYGCLWTCVLGIGRDVGGL
jgi:hypothetical protein